MRVPLTSPLCLVGTLLALGTAPLVGQATSYTLPGGYTTLPGQAANTDSYRTINMERPAETGGAGTVASATSTTITFGGSPGWAIDQWVPATGQTPYCVVVSSGSEDGFRGVITANDADTLTISPATPGDAANLNAGDAVTIRKCWTLADLFAGVAVPNGTEVHLRYQTTSGINQIPDAIIQYNSGNWVQIVPSLALANDTVLHLGETFLIRTSGSPLPDVVLFGDVPIANHRVDLSKDVPAASEDLWISFSSPVDTTISTLTWPVANGDELHVFDNTLVGINKIPSAILQYNSGNWVQIVPSLALANDFNLLSGVGYVLRRASGSPSPAEWNEMFSYRSSL